MEKLRYLMPIVLAGALVLGMPSSRVLADVDGDGLDEIGAFAMEVTGLARGPWYGIWNGNGSVVASQFLSSNFTSWQIQSFDANGDGQDEVVMMATRPSDQAVQIWVRGAGGGIFAQRLISINDFSGHQLFPINYDGGAAVEIGVGFIRDSNGAALYQVWNLAAGTLTQVSGRSVTSGDFGGHQWQAGDVDNDGNEEVVVGFTRKSNSAAAYQVWDPQGGAGGTMTVGLFATGAGFGNHQWAVGNFDPNRTGVEILHGFTSDSAGSAAYQVYDEAGTLVGGKYVVGAGFAQFDFSPINVSTHDNVLLGFVQNSNGVPAFQVWNAVSGTKVGGGFVLGPGFTVVDWLTGNFNANAADGQEIVVGFIRDSTGGIGFQELSRAGTILGGGNALGPGYVNPSFLSLRPASVLRDDVLIGAQAAGGAPLIQLWQGVGIKYLDQSIFNKDVV